MENGQYRKCIKLDYDNGMETWNYTWVEGIGDLFNGLIYYPPFMSVETFGLVCYCDSSGLVYQKWADITCDNVDSIGTDAPVIDEAGIFVFVDDNRNLLVNSQQTITNIEIFDVSGMLILESKTNIVSLAGLAPGIYVARVQMAGGYTVIRKVLLK